MLLKVYNALQTRLNSIPEVKLIDWFNDQYAGTIHAEPGIFIEFPEPILWETLRQQTQQGKLIVRVHAYSKVIAMQDKNLNTDAIDKHFTITQAIFACLQGFRQPDGDHLLFNSMMRTNLTHHQYMQGWFITTQDFECNIYDIQQLPSTQKPLPNIIVQ